MAQRGHLEVRGGLLRLRRPQWQPSHPRICRCEALVEWRAQGGPQAEIRRRVSRVLNSRECGRTHAAVGAPTSTRDAGHVGVQGDRSSEEAIVHDEAHAYAA